MKKILCITLSLLLILPVSLLTVSAIEHVEYTLYPFPAVMSLADDLVLPDSSNNFYYCEGILPSGYYQFFCYASIPSLSDELTSSVVYLDIESLYPGYDPTSPTFDTDQVLVREFSFENSDLFTYVRFYLHYEDGLWHTMICIGNSYPGDYPLRALYFGVNPPSSSFLEGISIDILDVMQHVISLLPIVFPVLISFVGIRKGIVYVREKIKSA